MFTSIILAVILAIFVVWVIWEIQEVESVWEWLRMITLLVLIGTPLFFAIFYFHIAAQ